MSNNQLLRRRREFQRKTTCHLAPKFDTDRLDERPLCKLVRKIKSLCQESLALKVVLCFGNLHNFAENLAFAAVGENDHMQASTLKDKLAYDLCLRLETQANTELPHELILYLVKLFQDMGLVVDYAMFKRGKQQEVVVCIACGTKIKPKAWTKNHDASQLIIALSGSARKQQLALSILMECTIEKDCFGLRQGNPVMSELKQYPNLQLQLFPLHQESLQKQLQVAWSRPTAFLNEPIHNLYTYFGPKIAMYFGWLSFYTKCLIVPAFCGVSFVLLECLYPARTWTALTFPYSLVLVLFASLFVGQWKRQQRSLEYEWKFTPVKEMNEQVLANFHGEWTTDPVTKKPIYDYPTYKRIVIRILLSIPVLGLMSGLIFAYVVGIAWITDVLTSRFPECFSANAPSFQLECLSLQHGPGVLNATAIALLDYIYQHVAHFLNDLENYRTKREAENELMLKLIPFHLINSNASLLYLMCYVQNEERLRQRLWTLLLISQFTENVVELFEPTVVAFIRWLRLTLLGRNRPKSGATPKSKILDQVCLQAIQAQYDDTFSDMKEMVIQYSYVTWYAPVFPLGAACALLNNIFEIRTDVAKLITRTGYQRPFASNANGIDRWERVLHTVSLLAVGLNCVILGLFKLDGYWPGLSSVEKIGVIVICEHLLFFVKLLIEWSTPEVPSWVDSTTRIERLNAYSESVATMKTHPGRYSMQALVQMYQDKWHRTTNLKLD